MTKDRLFILDPDYADPEYGGERHFYCRFSVMVEGLLGLFPQRAANIEVIRVPWPRPRTAVVETIGAENQNLPALVFSEGGFVNEIEALLLALHTRHGFPERHP